ncbi:MAG: hypothetical protein JNM24_01145 [Bdellovibrionaceae bacterium]|nr:hypothetical protein [Pseudobdellovibrionaceae bacterium]
MMKQKLLTLALTCLLWSQNSSAGLKVRFAEGSAADKASVKESLEKTARDFWFSEEQYWKVVPVEQELEIDFSLVSTDHLAQTRRHRINFNIYIPKADFDSTLRHELAHVFLSSQCPWLTDDFSQELFAYWRSGDYLRLLYGQKLLYTKSDAFKELKDSSKFGSRKTVAVARLINEIIKKGNENFLKAWFGTVLSGCQDNAFIEKQGGLAANFLDQLQGTQGNLAPNETGFLILDAQANEIMLAEGNWHKKQSVGSILKPFAVSFFSDIKKSRLKKNTTEWDCGDVETKNWDYKRALNYSCNGFFLDVQPKPAELTNYLETLNSLTGSQFQKQWLNMADIIGLWPTLQLNLLDVAKIYDYLVEKDPETLSVLKQTSLMGTLAGASDSKWFTENRVSLKSGTTTNLDLSVETGFIAAVFTSGKTVKIAILYRSGRRPIDLLPELKSKIQKFLKHQDSLAQVQVLSSFNLNSVQVTCPTILFKNGVQQPLGRQIDLQKMNSPNIRLSCAGEPFQVHAQDQMVRRLYGDLTFQKLKSVAKVDEARTEKNARARKGSELVLTTSEQHYLKSVLFSESGNYRNELKKALLLVFKTNLGFWASKKQPICDTTICQVFNLNYETITLAQKKSVDDFIFELESIHLGTAQWLEFSLGGNESWEKDVSIKDLSAYLNSSELKRIEIHKDGDRLSIVVNEKQSVNESCEKFRSYFKFRSCPDTAGIADDGIVKFSGRGEGHERGMDLTAANQLAIQGFNFDQIIEAFYKLKVQK